MLLVSPLQLLRCASHAAPPHGRLAGCPQCGPTHGHTSAGPFLAVPLHDSFNCKHDSFNCDSTVLGPSPTAAGGATSRGWVWRAAQGAATSLVALLVAADAVRRGGHAVAAAVAAVQPLQAAAAGAAVHSVKPAAGGRQVASAWGLASRHPGAVLWSSLKTPEPAQTSPGQASRAAGASHRVRLPSSWQATTMDPSYDTAVWRTSGARSPLAAHRRGLSRALGCGCKAGRGGAGRPGMAG